MVSYGSQPQTRAAESTVDEKGITHCCKSTPQSTRKTPAMPHTTAHDATMNELTCACSES